MTIFKFLGLKRRYYFIFNYPMPNSYQFISKYPAMVHFLYQQVSDFLNRIICRLIVWFIEFLLLYPSSKLLKQK